MQTIAARIEAKLGNDSKSLCDVGAILSAGAENENGRINVAPRSFSLWHAILRVISTIAALPLVAVYYCMLVVACIAIVIACYWRKDRKPFRLRADVLDRMFEQWGRYPLHILIKALEAALFSNQSVESPSLEVGCYTGSTSEALYMGKKLDYGMEFVPRHLETYMASGVRVFSNLVSGDIYDIPFDSDSLGSLFVVHSFDDIQRGADGAMSECARVLKPGGKMCFSMYTHRFLDNNLFVRILKRLGLKRSSERLFDLLFVGTHNCFSLEEWRDVLTESDMVVEKAEYFLPTSVGRIIDLPFRLEGYLINLFGCGWFAWPLCNIAPLEYAYKKLLKSMLAQIHGASFDASGSNKEGINLFVVARKKEGKASAVQGTNLFACPKCKGAVQKITALQGESLQCESCGRAYPIWKGVPLLLKHAAVATEV